MDRLRLDPKKMSRNFQLPPPPGGGQGQPQIPIQNSTNPQDYAPGQLNQQLMGLRNLRRQGAIPPAPGQQGNNLRRTYEQKKGLLLTAPDNRNAQQEMRYQTIKADLGGIAHLLEYEEKMEAKQSDREWKVQQREKQEGEREKLKLKAHFENLRRMGNAQRIMAFLSGDTHGGTMTTSDGRVYNVPTVAGMKPPSADLSAIGKMIRRLKNPEDFQKAQSAIGNRTSKILALAQQPLTKESRASLTFELQTLQNMGNQVNREKTRQGGYKQALDLQNLRNQKPQKPTVSLSDKMAQDQYKELLRLDPAKIKKTVVDTINKGMSIPMNYGTVETPNYKTIHIKSMNNDEVLRYFRPYADDFISENKNVSISTVTGKTVFDWMVNREYQKALNDKKSLIKTPVVNAGFISPGKDGKANPQKLEEVRKNLPEGLNWKNASPAQKIDYLKRQLQNNPTYEAEFNILINEIKKGGGK